MSGDYTVSDSPIQADLLIYHAGELATVASSGPLVGPSQGRLNAISDGAVAVVGERIALVGSTDEVLRRVRLAPEARVVDAQGQAVLPGFVDPHTHLVFAGTREEEWELRLRGASYQEITAAGGGINSTVRATRTASREDLVALGRQRLDTMVSLGTTTAEAKTGYGLTTAEELKLLEAIQALDRQHPIDLVPTFLGAHLAPAEYRGREDEYVDRVVEEMLPRVAQLPGLAHFCDVFCDVGAFTLAQARRVLEAARRWGLGLKIHADEFAALGGARLAAEMGAVSADHLVVTPAADMAAMARTGVVAVLLPATTFHLGKAHYAPARSFIEAGVPVALATDLNPGTSMTESMPMVVAIACSQMKMSPAEALVAATLNAAYAIGKGDEEGSLQPGKLADIVLLDAPNHRHLAYHFGVNLVGMVFKRGRMVICSGRTLASITS